MSTVEILTTYLASTDARDKLIKGAGCFFKVLGSTTGDANYLKLGASMSDCRCLMRVFSWLGNVQKLTIELEKKTVNPRDVIYILRVLFDGIFSLLDNAVYFGHFFAMKSAQLGQLSYASRASLFYGYVAAVILDIVDLAKSPNMPKRNERYLVLTRNACDMVSSIGNVSNINIGAANAAALGLISAIIATREQLMAAAVKTCGKKAK